MYTRNIDIIYDLIKDYKLSNDDVIYNCILKSKIFSYTPYLISNIKKLHQINNGDDSIVYISNDLKYVYKILNCTINKDWKTIVEHNGVSNLFLQLEQLYLLNKIFREDFATDIISIEKIFSQYVFIFKQPYKQNFYEKFSSKKDILKLKLKLHIYMSLHGFVFNSSRSKNITNTYFEYVYANNKYLIYDLSPDNITLINDKLFFYDLNCIKLEYL